MTVRPRTCTELYRAFRQNKKLAGKSVRTLQFYDEKVKPFSEWFDARGYKFTEINEAHVDEFMSIHDERNISKNTVNVYGRGIRAMLYFAHRRDWLSRIIEVTMPKFKTELPDYPSLPEVRAKLIEACVTNRTRNIARDKFLISLMLDSGLRKSEIVALNWRDLEWIETCDGYECGLVHVRNGKGDKSRSQYSPEKPWSFYNLIENYLKVRNLMNLSLSPSEAAG